MLSDITAVISGSLLHAFLLISPYFCPGQDVKAAWKDFFNEILRSKDHYGVDHFFVVGMISCKRTSEGM